MKVLLVNTYHYLRGGDCTYTFSLARLLRSQGHEVVFFGMHHPRNQPCEQSSYFVDYIDFVEANRDRTPLAAARVVSRSIYSLQARRRLSRLLRDEKPDLAHLQNIHAHLTPSVLDALAAHGVPVVWTLHDYKLICPNSLLLSQGALCESCKGGRFFQCVVKRCKKGSRAASLVAAVEARVHRMLRVPDKPFLYLAPSRFLRDKFVEFGWSAGRLRHVRNFLPSERLGPVRDGDDGYMLYLGQLEPWKGVGTLLRAAGLAGDPPLVIAGDGTQRAALQREAEALRLKNVLFVGHVGGRELECLISGAAAVVVPSASYENCPYSVMEAQAVGRPVIASRLGGLPELVDDDETGRLFTPGNEYELAEHMRALLANAGERRRLGRNARQWAQVEYAPEAHYERLSAVYAAARE